MVAKIQADVETDIQKKDIDAIVEKMKKEFPDEDPERHAKVLDDIFTNGTTPAKAMGFSPQFIEALYATAYQFFKGGDYTKALPIFKLLSKLDGENPRYMAAIGSCYFAKKEFATAKVFFIACSMIDYQDPFPLYYASECCIENKELLEAMFYLRGTIARAKEFPKLATLVQRTQLTLDNIKKILPRETKKEAYKRIKENELNSS